jgi:hypothetical protein
MLTDRVAFVKRLDGTIFMATNKIGFYIAHYYGQTNSRNSFNTSSLFERLTRLSLGHHRLSHYTPGWSSA